MKKKLNIVKWLAIALLALGLTAIPAFAGGTADDFRDFLYIGGQEYDIYHNASGIGWTYQACPRKITLNNYDGTEIRFNQAYPNNDDFQFEIVLNGTNKMQVASSKLAGEGAEALGIGGRTHCKYIAVRGNGTLTINYPDEEGLLYPCDTVCYLVNCGKITMNVPNENMGTFPFHMQSLPGRELILYNTDIVLNGGKDYTDTVYPDEYLRGYNSTFICTGSSMNLCSRGATNMKVFDAEGNEMENRFYHLTYAKTVFDRSIDYCVPAPVVLDSASDTITTKCANCGKVMYTTSTKACQPRDIDTSTKINVPKAVSGLVYNGKVQTGVKEGTGYFVISNTATNAGTYTATVVPKANYEWQDGTWGEKTVTYKISKAPVPSKVVIKTSKRTVKYAKVKKGTVSTPKLEATGAIGKLVFEKVSGSSKLTVTKDGKIKVKKGTKKGTYKIKVRATSSATKNYKAKKSAIKTITVKVK